MDPQQFDALSRTFAHASTRRRAIARVGAAGLLAGLAGALGRGRAEALPAAQGETCRLAIVATVRLGPDATERMQTDVPGELRGELSFTLGPDGALDAGRLLLDGGPEAPVVGQATGHALNLRADLSVVQEGLALVLVGHGRGTAQPLYRRGRWPADRPAPRRSRRLARHRDRGRDGDDPPDAGAGRTERPDLRTGADPLWQRLRRSRLRPQQLWRLWHRLYGGTDVQQWLLPRLPATPASPSATAAVSISTPMTQQLRALRQGLWSGRDRRIVCSGGECVLADCSGGMEYCGAVELCRDLMTDPDHCGACGNACPSGFCSGGVCQSVPIANIPLNEAPPDGISSCPPGLVHCNSGCVDINIDIINCGRCGAVCGGGDALYICQGGQCVPG